ncbi:MAG TPA: Mur ligase family protein [Chroococcales cyanobacterium]
MSAKFTGDEILYAAGGRIVKGGIGSQPGRVVWDLDEIGDGDWFVATSRGAEDTHDSLSEAFEKGARGCIVNRQSRYSLTPGAGALISVADTRTAILELVRYWRYAVKPRVIVVTGTSGRKAIVKLLEFLLKDTYRCHLAFERNGPGLSCMSDVLQMPKNTEVLIAEVSGAERGDIARVGSCLAPDLAIVGNIEHPHLSFEGKATTAALHCEILDAVFEGGSAVVFDQSPDVEERAKKMVHGLRSVLFSQTPDFPKVAQSGWLADYADFSDSLGATDADRWCAWKASQALGISPAKKEEFFNLT